MPKYIIERNLAGVGALTSKDLRGAALKSNDALRALAPSVQWIESYVTIDKLYCVYIAENEEFVREHAKRSGFSADSVTEVRRRIDPTTAER